MSTRPGPGADIEGPRLPSPGGPDGVSVDVVLPRLAYAGTAVPFPFLVGSQISVFLDATESH